MVLAVLCTPAAAQFTSVQKDFLKEVMDDLRKTGNGEIAVGLNKYIAEGRVVFKEKSDAGVNAELGPLSLTESNVLVIQKEAADQWNGLKNEAAQFRDKGNSKGEKRDEENAQILIRSASLTMIHEEVHMGQHNPLQIPMDEDPAYEAQISEARRIINEDMREIQEILDKKERLPSDQDRLNELIQDLKISRRAYMDMINSFQQDVIDYSKENYLKAKVTPEKFENATPDMLKLAQEAQNLINRANLEKESPSAGSLGKIIGTKGAFISSGSIVGGTDHLGFASCLCRCGCSQAGWACGSGVACDYIASPLGDCLCAGFGEGHAPLPGSGECYEGCVREYGIKGMESNKTPLSPVSPFSDNIVLPGHLIQTEGDTIILLNDGSKILAKPGCILNFTSTEPGKTRANLLSGSIRVEHATGISADAGSLEVQMADKTVQPMGTEFVCQWDGARGKVSVMEGSVSIANETSEETLEARKEIALPQGTVSDYDLSSDDCGLVAGIPLRDLLLDEGEPEPSGEYDPSFEGGKIPEDWVWQDPGSDAKLDCSPSGGLMATVPDGNEFWGYPGVTAGQRSDAPRLLHKVTGDFDLHGRVYLDTKATDLAAVEFIYYSPGSYIGQKSGLMKQDLLGEHYNLPGGGWLRAGGLSKLPVLGRPSEVTYSGYSAELKSAPDAPDEPVFLKFSRRGNVWKTYHSLDGESWILSSRTEVNVSQTIWVGWVFKRIAYDGLKDVPAVITLEDVHLKTAGSSSLPLPEWDEILQAGSAEIEGDTIRLSLDGSGRGVTAVQKGAALIGDFQATMSFQVENKAPESGESRSLALIASNSNGHNNTHIGWTIDKNHVSQLYTTEFLSVGHASGGAHDYTDDWSGRLRIVRQDGNISTYFWKDEDWSKLGNFQRGYPDPVYIGVEVSNEREATANASMTAEFTIDEIAGTAASSTASNAEGDAKIDTNGTQEENDVIEPEVRENDGTETGEVQGYAPQSQTRSGAVSLSQRDFAFEKWGAYKFDESSGTRYFAGYVQEPTGGMEGSLAPLLWDKSGDKSLMDQGLASEVLIDRDEEGTIAKNMPLNLSDGYQLHLMSVDAESETAYIELTRYGEVVDSSTLSPRYDAPMVETTYCYRTDLGSAKDIVQIAVHFKNAFAAIDTDIATYDGVFQISSSPISYALLDRRD